MHDERIIIKQFYFSLFFLTIFLLLFSSTILAQTRDTIYLWPDKVPGEEEVKHAALQTDNTNGNVIRLTDVTNPVLIVFEAEKPNNSGTGIIICPGGAYNILAIDLEGYEIAEWFNKLGYTTFVLQYRVPNKQSGALNDIQRAIRIVRDRSEHYHLDPGKIGIMGFSAGGSLCARASTRFTEDSYNKIDNIDNLSCRPDFSMLIYPAYLDKGINRSITPELIITENTPPFFIFGTSDDGYGNSSLVMATALRDNKIPVELHFLPEGGHGYGLRKGNPAAEFWPVAAGKWLEQVLENKSRLK
ncbi:alpha/beta hydrolase [Bacteroidota bacterium]